MNLEDTKLIFFQKHYRNNIQRFKKKKKSK